MPEQDQHTQIDVKYRWAFSHFWGQYMGRVHSDAFIALLKVHYSKRDQNPAEEIAFVNACATLFSLCGAFKKFFTVLPGSLPLISPDNIQGRCPGSSEFISEGRFPRRQEENESSRSAGGRSLRPKGCLYLDMFEWLCVCVCVCVRVETVVHRYIWIYGMSVLSA